MYNFKQAIFYVHMFKFWIVLKHVDWNDRYVVGGQKSKTKIEKIQIVGDGLGKPTNFGENFN